MADIRAYMKEHTVLLDGAMGTLLQAKGLVPGEFPERWNLSHPKEVIDAHRSYFDAGSNVVLTDTFGANLLKFQEEELGQIVRAAVRNVREAAALSSGKQEKFAALDIGPLGKLLRPYGDLEFEEAVRIFSGTVKAALPEKPDLVFIETMNDSYETKAALLAVRECCDLPVFVSNSYGEDGRLMTGASPEAMIAMLEGIGADAIGVNCSLGPKELKPVIEAYLANATVPVLAKPNAGLPVVKDGKTVFTVTPEEFALQVAEFAKLGVRLVGGCCGTNPEFIRALSEKAAELPVQTAGAAETTVISSYTHAVRFGKRPVVIGERINPTGKKRLKQALAERDMAYILNEADGQAQAGSDVLDVNAGLPEIKEAELLPMMVQEIQTVTDLPLVIDTADPEALEKSLRLYNGKALVNSVNGKKESMEAVFPLVKKYGGAVIALTLDENGIPDTARGRLEIAKRIIETASRYGIPKKEFIVDPLALTVSASQDAAAVTLESVRLITEELGVCTSLGVSNISFGLPERTVINRTFLAMAMERGLSAAILNPYSTDMTDTVAAFRLLKGMDEGCREYIAAVAEREETKQPARPAGGVGTADGKKSSAGQDTSAGTGDVKGDIYGCVTRGLKEQAARLAAEALKTELAENTALDPMALINEAVIPALDEVGVKFEQKKLFLPQLLLSAEAASAVFEEVKHMSGKKSETGRNGKVVLATVHGDIHDIGKGIVRLLLENYGFIVVDLGKDVPEDTVIEAVKKEKAPLCGLSALMTTTVPAMEKTIEGLRKECPWCKVVVGGAVLSQKYADMIGADRYAATAMDTVRYAEDVIG